MLDEGLDEGLRRVSVNTQYTPLQHGNILSLDFQARWR